MALQIGSIVRVTFDYSKLSFGCPVLVPAPPFVTMPKKSKRRAKTGGSGGGGGKVPGGGGRADDTKKQTARNSYDENNILPAGILTAGAVRMFTECVKGRAYSVPKNAAPVLQVVSDVKDGVDSSKWCYLSDGARCIFASLSTRHGHARLLATNQVMRHSVIRVPGYCVVEGETESGVVYGGLFVARMEVVERDARQVLGRTLPTSCAVDGILTAGAIRMLLGKEYLKKFTIARKSALALQIMGDPVDFCQDGFEGRMLELSDGKDWTKGLVISNTDKPLMSTDLMIKHSIIRMDHCLSGKREVIRSGVPFEEGVLVLEGVEVVARNVGRLIGNPAEVKEGGDPTRSSSPSNGLVREVWSYEKKLQFARAFWSDTSLRLGDGSGDIGPALHHLSSYFHLPRDNTEPYRAVMLVQWIRVMSSRAQAMKKREFSLEMVADYDRFFNSDSATCLMRRLSSEERGEGMLVRALAYYIRGQMAVSPFAGRRIYTGSESKAVRYLRNYFLLSSKCDLSELDSAFNAMVGGPQVSDLLEEFLVEAEDLCLLCLSLYGGPSQRQVSSIFDPSSDDVPPFFLTVGGNICDCCGKAPEEANLPVLFKCKTCRLAWYCSASCQAKCWANGHRDCCKKFGRFDKGDEVILHGLKKRPDLNGTLVSVEEFPLNGRAAVRVLWPTVRSVQVGAVLSIKKENMRHHRPLK